MLVLLLAVCCFVAGWSSAGHRSRAALEQAQQQAAVCADQLRSKASAMEHVRSQLDDLRARHEAALAQATAALDAREAQMEALRAERDRRIYSIGRLVHDDPAVAALDRLPVPAALARQLWPASGQGAAAAPH
ncbi:MAG: hypothetical protein F9K31_02455 [Dokdonella sp.]|nr:MAG: hypothetical protein F9K31_02455 [Dokdonella sp.]